MRVIAGRAKGHKLKTLEGLDTRPTLDRIKETLFNMIATDVIESDFLDLFSGSGGIGIEALSRGASSAVFVDSSNECCNIIKENLAHTKLADLAVVYNDNVISTIKNLAQKNQKFDIIFIDPPYEAGYDKEVLESIVKLDILKEHGFIIIERASKFDSLQVDGLCLFKEKNFGKTTSIYFYELEDNL